MKKEINNEISIVTAFFDIGRGEVGEEFPDYLKRTNEEYFEYFSNLAELENEMVIFTSQEFENKISEIRKDKPTKIIVIDIRKKFGKQMKKIREIQQSREFQNKVNKEMLVNIEYWSPEYVLINNLKTYFVNHAINKGFITKNIVSWVDFGYVREKETLNDVKYWKYNFDRKKIHFFTIRKKYKLNSMEDVYNAIFNNLAFIIGGAIVGTPEKWKEFYKLLRESQNELLSENIIDDDQGVYIMSVFKNKNLFKLNYLGKERWFYLFKKYDETAKIPIKEKIRDIFK